MRKQRQYPNEGVPPRAAGARPPGRAVIPKPANDNAKPIAAQLAAIALLAAGAAAFGWLGLHLLF